MQSKNKTILYGLIAYFCIRLFSFYFPPEISILNTIVSSAILLAIGYWLITKSQIGWLLIAAEMLLGGSGNFLSIGPIALRTALLFFSLAVWKIQKLLSGELLNVFKSEKRFFYISFSLFLVVVIGALNGFMHGHLVKNIFSEFAPYLYFFYYFPLIELLKNQGSKQEVLQLLYAAVFGCTLFTLGTFIIYTSHLGVVQNSYYHWFRDISGGKITDLTNNYFRVVLSEHLALIPLLLYFVFKKGENQFLRSTAICSLVALYAVNLTRAYLLGLLAGLLVITLFKRSWEAARISVATLIGIIVFFSVIHCIASTNHTLGLEFFGLRIGSIVVPNIEDSSLSRLFLLPIILNKIKANPVLGTGLGDTITVYSPVVKQIITTTQFDWGFLQIQAELGILGSFGWLSLMTLISFLFIKNKNTVAMGIFASLSVATLTGPVLFHTLGIICIVVLYATTLRLSTRA